MQKKDSASRETSERPTTNEEWLELDEQYRLRVRRTSPFVLERGEGVHLWDTEGKEFIDFMSGQVCVSVGHSDPELVRAISEQVSQLMQTGIPFTTPQEVLLAKKLAELAPGGLQRTFFACTGSESNEIALRMAKFYTRRQEIVALSRGYHGATYGSWSITGHGGASRNPDHGVGMPGVTFLPTPDPYRCLFCQDSGRCDLTCLDYSESLLDETTSGQPAAIIMEPILSAGGIIVPTKEYFQRIRRICDARGALMIVDEAQTAFGRTGKWFAIEHFDVVPDMVTLSKSLGGGVPLSAVMTTSAIADDLESRGFSQVSSHGGDPLLTGFGLANIEIIEKRGLLANAERMGSYLRAALEDLKNRYEIVGDVRGIGLLLGIEIVRNKETREPAADLAGYICSRSMENGLILFGGGASSVIRIAPPLILTPPEADRALDIMEEAIKWVAEGGSN